MRTFIPIRSDKLQYSLQKGTEVFSKFPELLLDSFEIQERAVMGNEPRTTFAE